MDELIASMLSAKPESRPSMSVVLGQVERFRKRATGVKSGWQKWALLAGASAIVIGGGLALLSRTPQRAEMDPYPTYVEARASALHTCDRSLHRMRMPIGIVQYVSSFAVVTALSWHRCETSFMRGRATVGHGKLPSLLSVFLRTLLRVLCFVNFCNRKRCWPKSCDFIRTDPLSRQQLLVASSLLMLQDQVALPVLRAHLRCYPQENPGFGTRRGASASGSTFLWADALRLRRSSCCEKFSWQDESIEPFERTLLLQTDAELEDSIRWLRSQERLQRDDSLTIRRLFARLGDTQSEQSLVQLAQPSSARKWEAAASLLYSRPWDEAPARLFEMGSCPRKVPSKSDHWLRHSRAVRSLTPSGFACAPA